MRGKGVKRKGKRGKMRGKRGGGGEKGGGGKGKRDKFVWYTGALAEGWGGERRGFLSHGSFVEWRREWRRQVSRWDEKA